MLNISALAEAPLGVLVNRKLFLSMAKERLPYLSISVQNAYPLENSGGKRRRIPELERGLGQTILQQMAEKYDGEFQTLAENGRYTATLILKEPAGRTPSGVLPQQPAEFAK